MFLSEISTLIAKCGKLIFGFVFSFLVFFFMSKISVFERYIFN